MKKALALSIALVLSSLLYAGGIQLPLGFVSDNHSSYYISAGKAGSEARLSLSISDESIAVSIEKNDSVFYFEDEVHIMVAVNGVMYKGRAAVLPASGVNSFPYVFSFDNKCFSAEGDLGAYYQKVREAIAMDGFLRCEVIVHGIDGDQGQDYWYWCVKQGR